MADDPHDLARFLDAQDGVYDDALGEIRGGRKRTHWMWFIFPQFAGLGASATSEHFAIRSVEEARAFLEHPVLGPRLIECAKAAASVEGRTAREVFGTPDDLKLRSSATLFASVSPDRSVFHEVLEKYFDGTPDQRTLALIRDVCPSN